MFRQWSVAALVVIGLAVPATAQDAPSAEAVLEAAAEAMGTHDLQSVRYSGTGYVTSPGQSYSSALDDTWPRYDMSYTRTMDYTSNSWRDEQVRNQSTWSPRGGGGRPTDRTDQTVIEAYAGGYAWNVGGNGTPQSDPRFIVQRQLEIILTPHGFIKAALEAPDATVQRQIESSRSTRYVNIVTFKALGQYPVNGWFNADNQLVRAQTWLPHELMGDLYLETRYTNYQTFDGIQFPTDIHRSWGNPPHPGHEIHITSVEPNVADAALLVPDAVASAVIAPDDAITTTELAPGVWMLGGQHNSLAVEFADYAVIIEAPRSIARGRAVIEETRRLIPTKPIRYVLNTHHHFDHSSGLRPFGADDIVVITHESNFNFYEGVVFDLRPRLLVQDGFATAPRQVHYELVDESFTLTDGTRTLEVVHVETQHSADMLVGFIRDEGILLTADLFNRRGPLAVGNPDDAELALYHAIRRNEWEVRTVVPVHGPSATWAEFMSVVGVATELTDGE
jgi:glyoxylase-like metal-dependent hydrolase (beta-lactamase superfamily II)